MFDRSIVWYNVIWKCKYKEESFSTYSLSIFIESVDFNSGLNIFLYISLLGKKTWSQSQSNIKVNIIN